MSNALCLNSAYDSNNTVGKLAAPVLRGALNPQVYRQAEGFVAVNGQCDNRTAYTTRDARLVDSARGMQTYIDRIPSESSVWMGDVYNPAYVPDSYARQPTWYGDIADGSITYYIDPDVAPAFRKQVYNIDGVSDVQLFTTPMGKVEPVFTLIPRQSTFNNVCKDSRTRDQLLFRNDLMSRQQRVHNKQRYEALR